MKFTPYLNFKGNCDEAFAFYERVLGGKIVMKQTHGESPMKDHVSADWQNKIMHARLAVGNQVLMGSDAPPEYYAPPQGMTVSITVDTAEEAERIFKAFSEGGRVTMEFQKTFWSPGFGMLTDRFGIPWMVNAEPGQA